ncbi:hypothetical protein PSE_0964 [Pseudovibrio sp. FO-BEG1]|nr:hypothetical protein PSE_0964 [Pseudovibrio sp. FO-BEG1]
MIAGALAETRNQNLPRLKVVFLAIFSERLKQFGSH